jgi:predicted amidophosphoribosyltransferase
MTIRFLIVLSAVALLLLGGLFAQNKRSLRNRPGYCPECGHPLPSPASPRCPACGENV